jgi:hypothetical protein
MITLKTEIYLIQKVVLCGTMILAFSWPMKVRKTTYGFVGISDISNSI